MLKIGDKLICKTKGKPETAHCIRGIVKSIEGDNVTINRALKFGQLPMEKDLTLPEEELLKYYTPVDDYEYCDETETHSVYEVTISRTGVVYVKADSGAAAMELADHLTTDKISWSDDWSPTDVMEADGYEGVFYTEPSF